MLDRSMSPRVDVSALRRCTDTTWIVAICYRSPKRGSQKTNVAASTDLALHRDQIADPSVSEHGELRS